MISIEQENLQINKKTLNLNSTGTGRFHVVKKSAETRLKADQSTTEPEPEQQPETLLYPEQQTEAEVEAEAFTGTVTATEAFDSAANNEIICAHLYTNAYLNGLYSDLVVRIAFQGQNNTAKSNLDGVSFKLHRIMAIRSPLLARMIKDTESQSATLSIQLATSDPYLSRGGLGIAFGHLYASYSSLLLANKEQDDVADTSKTEDRAGWLRSVLSASRLLELPDLSQLCIEHMKELITMNSVAGMAKFFSDDAGSVLSTCLQDLKDAVFTYLCKEFLDDVLESKGIIWGGNSRAKGYLFAVDTFASLPFQWIKGIIESKYFDSPSEMERFNFAKSVIDRRAYQSNKQGSSNPMLAGTENVLFSFGQKNQNTGVTLVRKAAAVSNAATNASVPGDRRVWKASQHF